MEKIIFLKYGELSTKKANKNYFLKTLADNIKKRIDNIEIYYDQGRMFIKVIDDNYDKVVEELKNVFGIHKIVEAYRLENNDFAYLENVLTELLAEIEFKTFKVETKRSNKDYPLDSMEISRKLGGIVLKNFKDCKVDVNNPELVIHVEIRRNEALIYFKEHQGLGGYPVGTLGKGLLMLSGGIDSPVAGYLGIKRGIKLEAIYFESPPHTSEKAKDKVKSLAKVLANYNNDIKLHVINFTEIQESIYKNIPHEYLITIMRRMMYRICEGIIKKTHAQVLINGESIGQVASQTLTSMTVINEVVNVPVIRPVACFDKLEIIDLAKKIGTYETSILPFEDCCTIFVPEHPVINPCHDKCLLYEKTFNYQEMIDNIIDNHEVMVIKNKTENKYQDLL